MSPAPSLGRRLVILWSLYFVQGLPFGFQATALPVYLRDAGVSLTGIGLASALSLPWMLKVLWAPLVDRWSSPVWGRRRSWILPLQGVLAALCATAAAVSPGDGIVPLLLLILGMNLAAATMDIAVDGLAVDMLEVPELGRGNIAQVVGFKLGMLTGGGLLVWASGAIGWAGLFLVMAVLVTAILLFTLSWRERDQVSPGHPRSPLDHPRLGEVLGLLRRQATTRGAGWVLLFIGTYKLGETLADTMFKPFLVDAGYSAQQIGLWVGTWGMLFSIAGSWAGGFLASRLPLLAAVGWAAAFRAVPVAGEWWLTLVEPTASRALAVTCAEHFFGGALTTALFAWMMSRVDRRIGATHYTLLASIEVWGKLPVAVASGALTDATSYPVVFGVATVLSILYLLLLVPLSHLPEPPSASGSARRTEVT